MNTYEINKIIQMLESQSKSTEDYEFTGCEDNMVHLKSRKTGNGFVLCVEEDDEDTDLYMQDNCVIVMSSITDTLQIDISDSFATYADAEEYMCYEMQQIAAKIAGVGYNYGDGTGSVVASDRTVNWAILSLKDDFSLEKLRKNLNRKIRRHTMEWKDLVVNGEVVKETADLVNRLKWTRYYPYDYTDSTDCAVCIHRPNRYALPHVAAVITGRRDDAGQNNEAFVLDAFNIMEFFKTGTSEHESLEKQLDAKTLERAKLEAEEQIKYQFLQKGERLKTLMPQYFN